MDMDSRFLIFLFILPLIATWQVNTQQIDNSVASPNLTDDSVLAKNVFNFGLKLQNAIIENGNDNNVALSPTSIVGVLALVLLGSVGNTYDELVKSLGFYSDVSLNQNHHRLFGANLQNLNTANVSSKTLYANAIFVDEDAHLREIYRDFIETVYKSSVFNVNFADDTNTLGTINKWVSDNTNNKIPELLRDPLPPYTKVVLASALYFSGQWLYPFKPEYTLKMPFSIDSKNASQDKMIDMMLNAGKFQYTYSFEHDCELVAIPYNDSVTTFYAIKPRNPKKKSLNSLLQELNVDIIEKLINEATLSPVVIRLPKLNIKTNYNLRKSLESLGIGAIFSPKDANFALMVDANQKNPDLQEELVLKIGDDQIITKDIRERLNALPNPGLHVDSVVHEVAIKIDEYGTEAAAATAGLISRTAQRFIANSPFFFFIRNESTKLVTFSAAVLDPTK